MMKRNHFLTSILLLAVFLAAGCNGGAIEPTIVAEPTDVPVEPTEPLEVPYENRWGIYSLDLSTQEVDLIFSSPDEMTSLRMNSAAEGFVFSMKVGGDDFEHTEIFTVKMDGSDLQQLTFNNQWDVYPAWSPDGAEIAFLSWRDSSLDIYIMQRDGSDQKTLYDSGGHDADIHWLGNRIVFTRDSQIWIMDEEGDGAYQLTDPPRAGEWGDAVLPFGDYDPRISPDGSRVVFSRMVDDRSQHGNYDLFMVEIDGSNEVKLTDNGYTQGLSSWSSSGDRILFIVSAMDDVGKYDLYTMKDDGTRTEDITPSYFPDNFLCHWGIFGEDDTKVYFLGEWWVEESEFGLSEDEANTLSSLQEVDDYPLYTMTYYGDYHHRASMEASYRAPSAEITFSSDSAWGCSLFAAFGDEENMLYGRNFDWEFSPALLLFTDEPGAYASVSMVDIAYLGFGGARAHELMDLPLNQLVGLLDAPFLPFDGMNETGLAIGMAAVPPGDMQADPDKETIGSLGVMREMLDYASSLDEALEIMQTYNVDMVGGPPLHYLIADKQGDSVLVEFYDGEMVVIPNQVPWHQATNFLRAAVGDVTEGVCWRHDIISERLEQTRGQVSVEAAFDLLEQVSQAGTQWSVVYELDRFQVNVVMGQQYDSVHTFKTHFQSN